MGVLPENIKFYQCLSWDEGDSHGGDIDPASEIMSGIIRNIFDDVTNQERIDGKVEYRKIYVRNENSGDGSDWSSVKTWISQFTPATNDEISITAQGSNSDTQEDAKNYTYYQPDLKNHVDVLDLGTLLTDQYHHIWIKRIVQAGGDGYFGNNFKLTLESA